jgi:hypothetical protein
MYKVASNNARLDSDGASNIWSRPVNGEPPKQLSEFTSEVIEGFDWLPNGHLICAGNSTVQDIVRFDNFRY